MNEEKKRSFSDGFRDAFPVCVGYFGVSFTLGITARNAGLTAFQAAFMSLLNSTSAGQAAAIRIIKDGGTYSEIIISQIVINLRYLLMSAALSIKVKDRSVAKRALMSMGITDEIFGLSITQKGYLNPTYTLGCFSIALPGWVLGTFFGVIMGNIMPSSVTQALSMGLYAMFIAIIIPPAVKDIKIAVLIAVSMTASWLCSVFIKSLSSVTSVIILTIAIGSVFAFLFPVKEDKQ